MPYTGGIPVPYLKAWREHFYFSLDGLEKVSGVDRYTILALEKGRHKGAHIRTIDMLTSAFGISRKQFLQECPKKEKIRTIRG